jgi:hypothetical protein
MPTEVKKIKNEVRKIVEHLDVELTDEELLQCGSMMADAEYKYAALDREKKASAESFKERMDREQHIINDNARLIKEKIERRPVDCHVTLNEPEGQKTCVRLDTGEVVWIKPLTEDEKQLRFEVEA